MTAHIRFFSQIVLLKEIEKNLDGTCLKKIMLCLITKWSPKKFKVITQFNIAIKDNRDDKAIRNLLECVQKMVEPISKRSKI